MCRARAHHDRSQRTLEDRSGEGHAGGLYFLGEARVERYDDAAGAQRPPPREIQRGGAFSASISLIKRTHPEPASNVRADRYCKRFHLTILIFFVDTVIITAEIVTIHLRTPSPSAPTSHHAVLNLLKKGRFVGTEISNCVKMALTN